jgi:succinate dehydrogenase / fumarate reductase flavoprotein subunit
MCGLWVDYARTADRFPDLHSARNHQTNLAGVYAAGECEYQYHGANRLGANALLSCIYAGKLSGLAAVCHLQGLEPGAAAAPAALLTAETRRWEQHFGRLLQMDGPENPYALHEELGDLMTRNVTIVRHNDALRATDQKLQELAERWRKCSVLDASGWANSPLMFLNQLHNMLVLARVITLGALQRDESRGSHYKPEFPRRDDAHWLKTTIASHGPEGPVLSYEEIDTSLIQPVERKYD